MSSNYPTSKDTLTNPTSTDTTAAVSHSSQHINANDAIEAIQDTVGITNSIDTDSITYKLTNTNSVSPGHKHVLNDNTDIDTTGAVDGNVLIYNGTSSKFEPSDTDAPDASTTVKGVAKMSVAPASATEPIAVGDNDTRVPSQGENDALVGNNTDIAVGSGNKYVTQTGLQAGAEIYAADAEASDTYVITLSPAPTAYATGMVIHFKANTANTGACTLNVNGLGAKSIVNRLNQSLFDNDIRGGQIVSVVYDGTNFQMLSFPGSQEYELEASSTNIQASADTERSESSTSYVKKKEIEIGEYSGTIYTRFDVGAVSPGSGYGKVYINGVAQGVERTNGSTFQTYTENFSVSAGDLVQLYAHAGDVTYAGKVRNFRIGYNIVESIKTDITGSTVNTD